MFDCVLVFAASATSRKERQLAVGRVSWLLGAADDAPVAVPYLPRLRAVRERFALSPCLSTSKQVKMFESLQLPCISTPLLGKGRSDPDTTAVLLWFQLREQVQVQVSVVLLRPAFLQR